MNKIKPKENDPIKYFFFFFTKYEIAALDIDFAAKISSDESSIAGYSQCQQIEIKRSNLAFLSDELKSFIFLLFSACQLRF